jgi:hypothetical protein
VHSKRNRRPRWNALYLILLMTIGGLVLTPRLHLTSIDHKIVLLLIVVVIYGVIGLWIKSNTEALQDLDDAEYRKQSRDPAVYGTRRFPTRTQAHFRDVTSFYRHESPDKPKR